MDIEANVRSFLLDRGPNGREASFDYCFNHFQSAFVEERLPALVEQPHLELSCLQLGFYLASWGMFRGRSKLLRHSSRFYEPLVRHIARADSRLWTLDLPDYDESGRRLILEEAQAVRSALFPSASDILVTKVMLGVYGCVPAFDTYFVSSFGGGLCEGSLVRLRDFYLQHAITIDRLRPSTIGFLSGDATLFKYTAAKIVDMHFFTAGMRGERGHA